MAEIICLTLWASFTLFHQIKRKQRGTWEATNTLTHIQHISYSCLPAIRESVEKMGNRKDPFDRALERMHMLTDSQVHQILETCGLETVRSDDRDAQILDIMMWRNDKGDFMQDSISIVEHPFERDDDGNLDYHLLLPTYLDCVGSSTLRCGLLKPDLQLECLLRSIPYQGPDTEEELISKLLQFKETLSSDKGLSDGSHLTLTSDSHTHAADMPCGHAGIDPKAHHGDSITLPVSELCTKKDIQPSMLPITEPTEFHEHISHVDSYNYREHVTGISCDPADIYHEYYQSKKLPVCEPSTDEGAQQRYHHLHQSEDFLQDRNGLEPSYIEDSSRYTYTFPLRRHTNLSQKCEVVQPSYTKEESPRYTYTFPLRRRTDISQDCVMLKPSHTKEESLHTDRNNIQPTGQKEPIFITQKESLWTSNCGTTSGSRSSQGNSDSDLDVEDPWIKEVSTGIFLKEEFPA